MCNYNETESGYCEYCNHESNEDAKRFPLFNENAKREEAFIDEDNYLSVYTESGEWVGVGIKFCPMCGRIGTSFDGPALFKTLLDLNPPNGLCAILGNGGVLPAILPFLAINRPVHVYARRPKMGEQPLENFNADDYAVIVNTIPFTANLQLNFNNTKPFTYYDLNYADHRLLEQAKANPMCVSCSDGIPMLETQAAMSLDWWRDILNNKKFSK